jgi:branched-chain amino acid transport system substrate-binding protein
MALRQSLFLSFFSLALLTGCKQQPGSDAAATATQIPVGEYGSMSGTEATFGQSTHMGVQLAVDEANAAGGVLGKPINLTSEDDAGSQDQAVSVVQKLINADHVVAVLGEVASSNSLAGGGICQKYGVPMISPSSTNPTVTKDRDFVFRVCFTDDFQGSADAAFGLKKGWKSVAVLTAADSDYSKGLAEFFKANFTKGGGKIVSDEEYGKTDRDFKPQLTRIASSNPDAVYLPGYYTQVVLILRQARQLGLNVPFFGGDGWDSPETLALGKDADGCFFSTHYSPDEKRPEVQEFVTAFQAKYHSVPDSMAVTGYDAARVLFDAIKRAGKPDPTAIRDALAATKDFPGASGAITIDADRNASKPIVMLEIEGGKTTIADTIPPPP